MSVELKPSSDVESLRASLARVLSQSFSSEMQMGRPEKIAEVTQRLRILFNEQINTAPPRDLIVRATSGFLDTQLLTDRKQARLVAWGLAVPHVQDTPLLDMDEPFSRFISEIQRLQESNLLSIKLWRGLLFSYFQHSGPHSEKQNVKTNWDQLRVFLKDSFPTINQSRSQKPSWLLALAEHLNLLDTNPCTRYAQEILEGQEETVKDLQEALSIPSTSWFVNELLDAQIQLVCSFEDSRFKEHLSKLCGVLEGHSLYINKGLKSLLARYHQCADTTESPVLAKFAVAHWGNPKLQIMNTAWGMVSKEVKGMVLKWFISRDLQIFFEHFSRDHEADQDLRRFKFWMYYLDQIQDAYFALGPHAYSSQQEDYRAVRENNEGRILRLEKAGIDNSKNNAFLMVIGRYVIVEFGKTGNACFCYKHDSLPFSLTNTSVKGDRTELKKKEHPGCKFRLEHRDRPYLWETVFKDKLGELNIYPDAGSDLSRTRNSQRKAMDPVSRQNHVPSFEMEELRTFARHHRLEITDNRSRGGYLKIKPDVKTPVVKNRLQGWGFQRKPGSHWWLPETRKV